jgi:hypothetical protein
MTILNTFQEKVGSTWGIDYFWLIVAIVVIIGAIFVIAMAIKQKELEILLCLIYVIGLLIMALCMMSEATPIYETRYQILSTDPAITTEEFAEKYEIVGQDGLILTIRERD